MKAWTYITTNAHNKVLYTAGAHLQCVPQPAGLNINERKENHKTLCFCKTRHGLTICANLGGTNHRIRPAYFGQVLNQSKALVRAGSSEPVRRSPVRQDKHEKQKSREPFQIARERELNHKTARTNASDRPTRFLITKQGKETGRELVSGNV
jgi:hypothetical protein